MTKFLKEIVLALAPYKTIKLGVSETNSFAECDKELKAELDKHPIVRDLNKADIKKVLK